MSARLLTDFAAGGRGPWLMALARKRSADAPVREFARAVDRVDDGVRAPGRVLDLSRLLCGPRGPRSVNSPRGPSGEQGS